jgi:hypothetical protein
VASLAENTGAGEELADPSDPEHQSPDNLPQLSTRELMCAMWQGRLQHPTRAAQIHKRAKMIASGSRNASPSGISSTRGR